MALRSLASAYVIDEATDQLGSVDLATGVVKSVGSMLGGGMQRPSGLAYWRERGELWAVDANGGEVGTVDTMTGRFQAICNTGVSGFAGIAWHEATQRFYLSRDGGDIYELEPLTGELTLLGNCGYAGPSCLDVDADGSLVSIDEASGMFFKIDLVNGLGAPVYITVTDAQGLGFETETGEVLAVRGVDDGLYRRSIDNPSLTRIGTLGAEWLEVRGLQVIDDANATVARTKILGQACGGLSLTTQTVPRLQSIWWMNATLPASQGPQVLALGYNDPEFSLTPYGAPGCEIRTQAVAVYPIGTGSNVGFLIPSSLSLFVQAAASVPNANQLGAVYSQGLQGVIGW